MARERTSDVGPSLFDFEPEERARNDAPAMRGDLQDGPQNDVGSEMH